MESGVLVIAVEDHSPTQKAGLIEGDVIVGLDEHLIRGMDDLHQLLTEEKITRDCALTVIRQFEKMTLRIVPEEI